MNANIQTDMSASSNIWANLNIKAVTSLVRFVNAKKGEGERTVFSNRQENISLQDSFWKPMQIQGFPLDFQIPSSTENQSVWYNPTHAASVSPAVNCVTQQPWQNLLGHVLFKKQNTELHLFCSVFSTWAWRQPLLTITNQNCIWNLLQRDVFGSEEGVQLTSKLAFESEDTHGLSMNQQKTCLSGSADWNPSRHTRQPSLQFVIQAQQLLARSETSLIQLQGSPCILDPQLRETCLNGLATNI